MSKNLEKEYKELMTEGAPDLWERIEAGLEAKERTAKGSSLWRKYRMWGGAAAAGLSRAVVVPLVFGTAHGSSKSESGAQFDNMAAAEAEDGMAYEEEPKNYKCETSAGEALLSIRAKVTEISKEEGRTVYTVLVEDKGSTGFLEGNCVKLYDEGILEEELIEGESYSFDLSVLIIGSGTTKYSIQSIR